MTDRPAHHRCDPARAWMEYDARGIPLCRVCPECRDRKLAGFRKDVLTDPGYWHDEPLEEDRW